MGILYRSRQFWFALTSRPDGQALADAERFLPPALFRLFLKMHPGEQAHSLAVFCRLRAAGETDRDLLTAALLHDVGKSRCPLHLWERVFIVLARAAAPQRARAWGAAAPAGWRRALVVAEQHPAWGAQMAAQAGASPLAVELIRRHQDKIGAEAQHDPTAARLLRLQSIDNER